MRQDGEDFIPLWNWYRERSTGDLFRAMHMTKAFDYANPAGAFKGEPGQWLVEHKDGSWPDAYDDERFRDAFEVCPNPRPEGVMQPDCVGPPDQAGAPKREVV